MKNNILGFIVYLMAAIIFSPSIALILLAIKENSDRCCYYNGVWNKKDILLGLIAISIGVLLRFMFSFFKVIV